MLQVQQLKTVKAMAKIKLEKLINDLLISLNITPLPNNIIDLKLHQQNKEVDRNIHRDVMN